VDIPLTADSLRHAAARLAPWAHRTPVLTSRTLDAATGATIFLKCENLQRIGAFKFRGAMNALLQLDAEARAAGVITHSSGNHAQALALAGQLLGVPACIVMPRTAPAVKREATAGYGARIVPCEPTLAARESTVAAERAAHGYTLVHPYDDWNVIAGQATAAMELIEQAGPLDVIVAPVGGGGLLAGTALAAHFFAPGTAVVAAEPLAADDAARSLAAGSIQPSHDPKTIADGLRTSLGERGFAVIRRHVGRVLTVPEPAILDAMRFVMERLKIVIEPSSAVPVAAAMAEARPFAGRRVGIILSGANVDLAPLFQALATI
jgi:threonine dehydratase